MNEPTQLIPQTNGTRDVRGALERPRQPYPLYGSYPEDVSNGYNRLLEYWRSVLKNIWLVIGIVVLVSLLTAAYMARQPDVFESLSRVQVDLETANNPAIGALKGNSIVLNNPSQDPTYFNTQIQILTSAGLLGRVAKTLDLEHNETFLHPQSAQRPSIWQSVKRLFGSGRNNQPPKQPEENKLRVGAPISTDDVAEANRFEPYVGMLQGQVTVKPLSETRIIEIRFKHQDPEIAQKVNNAIAQTFVLSNLERKTETSNSAGDFLQKRIAELQSEIRRGEEELINYAKSHQILTLDASQNTVVDRLSGLNRQLLEAENERKSAEAGYRATLAPGALEAQAEATNSSAAALELKLEDLKRQRAQLLLEYTDKYPAVRDLDQQIAMTQKEADQLRTRVQSVVRTNLETRYRQTLQKEQALRQAYNQQRAETLTQNEAAVNYRIIQQEIDTNKTLLDGLLQRSKENDVILAGTPNNIHVVDYASLPKGPVAPKRMQTVALASLFALILGIALARVLDYLDDSVRSSQDVENFLHLPALAVIPAIASTSRRRLLAAIPGTQKSNGYHGGPELLLNESPRSALAEAFRQLRTSVLLASAGGAPKTLLVTSSQPSEGKTTTAVNTAVILAQTGAKVLVLDADMRRPRIHSVFNLENSLGLSGILSSKMTEAEMLAVVQHHEESGLYVLTSGRIPPNPAELLGSDQMRGLMATLGNTFAHIVIDSPPVASFTDGVLLSSVADGVLLVVHGGAASRHIVRRATQLLTGVGAKIFGVVLNNVTVSRHDYYYNRNYERYYYPNPEVENVELPSRTLGS
jgi:polysaccharide biosynthesis transport protein